MQHNRNRYYHPPLGRWTTRDPIRYEGSQWNLYEYLGSRSLHSVDPLGLSGCPPDESEINSGEAVPIGDVDGDGKEDYAYPNARPGTGFSLFCFSKRGGIFMVRSPEDTWVARCPYPDGQGTWGIDDEGTRYKHCVENPYSNQVICYYYLLQDHPPYKKGDLRITVWECRRDPQTGRLTKPCRRIRDQVIKPPRDPDDLPWPREVPHN